MAGLYEGKTTAFHLRQLAEAACQYPGDLLAKAEKFVRLSRIPYERAIRHIRDADSSDFSRTVENKANVPNRVVTWGIISLPKSLKFSPIVDVHSGYPYSNIDTLQNYVGTPNGQRFADFLRWM